MDFTPGFTRSLTRTLQITLWCTSILGVIGLAVSAIRIAIVTWRTPDLPFSLRLNPLNILANRDLWTPEIHRLNHLGVVFGLVFIGAALLSVLVGICSPLY